MLLVKVLASLLSLWQPTSGGDVAAVGAWLDQFLGAPVEQAETQHDWLACGTMRLASPLRICVPGSQFATAGSVVSTPRVVRLTNQPVVIANGTTNIQHGDELTITLRGNGPGAWAVQCDPVIAGDDAANAPPHAIVAIGRAGDDPKEGEDDSDADGHDNGVSHSPAQEAAAAERDAAAKAAREAELKLAQVRAMDWEVGSPWVGVQLAPVPKVLASHLQLDEERLMLLNIAVDSPADKAGLQQYDVVVELCDKAGPTDVDGFMSCVKKLKVGETLRMTVVRGGKKVPVELKITGKPELDTVKYKYEMEQEQATTEAQTARGWMMQRGDDGQWRWKRIDQDPNWNQLFVVPPPQPLAPTAPWPKGQGGDEGGSTVIVETKDDKTIEVRRNPDGSFRVTRKQQKDDRTQSSSKRYASVDALKTGDADAYNLFSRSTRGGWGVGQAFAVPAQPPVNMKELEKRMAEAQRAAEQAMRERERAMEQAQKEMERAMRQQGRAWTLQGGRARASDKPDVRFEAHDDGRISVTTREGDQELVQHFKSADELKAKRPDLYKKYQRISGASEEKEKAAPKSEDESKDAD